MSLSKHCIQCGAIHEGRSNYCRDECERTFNNRKREEKAGTKCRLCNRAFRRHRAKQEQVEPVLSEHTITQELQ
jgi:hypothetical protein